MYKILAIDVVSESMKAKQMTNESKREDRMKKITAALITSLMCLQALAGTISTAREEYIIEQNILIEKYELDKEDELLSLDGGTLVEKQRNYVKKIKKIAEKNLSRAEKKFNKWYKRQLKRNHKVAKMMQNMSHDGIAKKLKMDVNSIEFQNLIKLYQIMAADSYVGETYNKLDAEIQQAGSFVAFLDQMELHLLRSGNEGLLCHTVKYGIGAIMVAGVGTFVVTGALGALTFGILFLAYPSLLQAMWIGGGVGFLTLGGAYLQCPSNRATPYDYM
jgi:hypothetical protein